ncbi:MAG: hypothetical protein H7A51_15290 [Akkermansiaceae bacterium]|nr:hypothetical protein [Akkermansiaceae bacterium]
MTENNPYATPQSDISVTGDRASFHDLDTKALKKLRNNSHTIRALGGVNILVILVSASLLSLLSSHYLDQLSVGIAIAAIILGLLSAYALWWRPAGGRVIGILSCILMLASFPIGTLIGILGIISLSQSGILFGPDKPRHKDIEAEWKYRKKNKVG